VNIAVHFIRARSNLILSCSSGGFPMYIRCSVRRGEGGEGQNVGERGRKGEINRDNGYNISKIWKPILPVIKN